MTDEEAQRMRQENAYLKSRNAQLQDDIVDLGGQVTRLQQQLGLLVQRRNTTAPSPLSGGQ